MTTISMSYKTFGHYTIRNRIGDGATGIVYRALDLRLDRAVALKILKDPFREHEAAWGLLLQEARAASVLNHPNICTVYDVGEDKGSAYIASEYVEGLSLRELLRKGQLPLLNVIRYGSQVADALACMHEHGIIHRDLKPSNLLVGPESTVKIIDFGLAFHFIAELLFAVRNEVVKGHSPRNVPGTLPYLAAEVIRGHPASCQSDLWALGVLLHQMTSGRLPFEGDSPAELAMAIMIGAPCGLPRNTPAALAAIIGRCLDRNLDRRYRTAREILYDLHAAANKLKLGRRIINARERPIVRLH